MQLSVAGSNLKSFQNLQKFRLEIEQFNTRRKDTTESDIILCVNFRLGKLQLQRDSVCYFVWNFDVKKCQQFCEIFDCDVLLNFTPNCTYIYRFYTCFINCILTIFQLTRNYWNSTILRRVQRLKYWKYLVVSEDSLHLKLSTRGKELWFSICFSVCICLHVYLSLSLTRTHIHTHSHTHPLCFILLPLSPLSACVYVCHSFSHSSFQNW